MTDGLQRCPRQFSECTYDTIIIGGGIYGATLLLEAARKGLSVLMIEQHDFGSGTTANNFRILHGGLRSLQSGDLRRYRESVVERRWFLRTFPDLVEPLRCLMPYYGRGTKRKSVLKLAAAMNDLLSADRNSDVRADRHLGPTQLVAVDETIEFFPMVNRDGLKGGMVWHDAKMPDCHRILIEIVRWACEYGAKALNYVSATELLTDSGSVVGVRALDSVSGGELEFRAKTIISAAGPWTSKIPVPGGFPASTFYPSRAWNVLLDRFPVSRGAVAVSPPSPDGAVYFIHSSRGKLFVGTGHGEVSGQFIPDDCIFPDHLLDTTLSDVNLAIPGLDLTRNDVLKVYDGVLPVIREASTELKRRATVLDYSGKHGHNGLYVVTGVKFTTARSTAAMLIDKICRRHFPAARSVQVFEDETRSINRYKLTANDDELILANELAETESVVYLDDLLLRRLGLEEHSTELDPLRRKLQANSAFMSRIEE